MTGTLHAAMPIIFICAYAPPATGQHITTKAQIEAHDDFKESFYRRLQEVYEIYVRSINKDYDSFFAKAGRWFKNLF